MLLLLAILSSSIYAPHDSQNLPAQKQNNPIIHPMDGAGVGSCYAANWSNPQLSEYMPPNPIPASERCP